MIAAAVSNVSFVVTEITAPPDRLDIFRHSHFSRHSTLFGDFDSFTHFIQKARYARRESL